jgi:hypothetical protein
MKKPFKSVAGGPVPAGRAEQWKPSDAVKDVFRKNDENTMRSAGGNQ